MALQNEDIQFLRTVVASIGGLGLDLSALQNQVENLINKSEGDIDIKPLVKQIDDTKKRIVEFNDTLKELENLEV